MEFSRQEYWSMVAMPSFKGIFLTQRSILDLLQLLCCSWILYH